MRRIHIRRILVSLFLGIITTVAIAWFFAAFVRPQLLPSNEVHSINGSKDKWIVDWEGTARCGSSYFALGVAAPLLDSLVSTGSAGRLPAWVSAFVARRAKSWNEGQTPEGNWYLRGAGWPLESMWSEFEIIDSKRVRLLLGGIGLRAYEPGLPSIRRALPYYIFPSGFAIDAALYAALWFGLFTGLAFTRRKWRIRKGRCPACGYSLAGHNTTSSVCPECGKAAQEP